MNATHEDIIAVAREVGRLESLKDIGNWASGRIENASCAEEINLLRDLTALTMNLSVDSQNRVKEIKARSAM